MNVRAVIAQIAEEVKMTLGRGETLLVTFGIPLGFLIFFSEVDVLPTGSPDRVAFIAPGILCLATMSTSMVSLAIATGFERSYGVLKRLGASPLGRSGLVVAKIAAVMVLEIAQCLSIGLVAFGLGWRLGTSVGAGIGAIVLGTIAFGGVGLFLAGVLRAEVTLAVANATYIIFLLVGGIVFPLSKLGAFAPVAPRILPAGALSDILHPSLGITAVVPTEAWIALAIWAFVAPLLAIRTFRFA